MRDYTALEQLVRQQTAQRFAAFLTFGGCIISSVTAIIVALLK